MITNVWDLENERIIDRIYGAELDKIDEELKNNNVNVDNEIVDSNGVFEKYDLDNE